MQTLNYDLAGGNKTLLKEQARRDTVMFQLWYTLTPNATNAATNVQIEVYACTTDGEEYALLSGAGITLDPAKTTDIVSVTPVPGAWLEFRVLPNGAAGTIKKVDLLKLV